MSRDGQNGLDGKDGKDGTSISIKGSLNSESELPTPPANASDCYIIGSDLYIWTGSAWKNVGQFKGDKGDPGKDGVNGADGVNGVDGKDGVSIVWKGEYSSHPSNPQNGWAYKNTTDKKSYIYQDNTWYQMTIDGIDGQNGQDGKDGSDGADGLSIVWKGDLATPPTNPQLNWCYRDTDNGKVYIYNGSA